MRRSRRTLPPTSLRQEGPRGLLVRLGILLPLLLSISGCELILGPDGPVVSQLEVAEGDGQAARVGTAVAVAPAVRVKDEVGNPVEGAEVAFSVISGDGSLSSTSVLSNVHGLATGGEWVLGTIAGSNVVEARAGEGVTVRLNATGVPAPPARAHPAGVGSSTSSGGGDSGGSTDPDPEPVVGKVGEAVSHVPQVQVADEFGNPVAGVEVRFRVLSGGGSLDRENTFTDDGGTADPGNWIMGPSSGIQEVEAEIDGLNPVTFEALAEPGDAAALRLVAGDAQQAVVGNTLPEPVTLSVEDPFGNGVPDVDVTLRITKGEGYLPVQSARSDADGFVEIPEWRLGNAATLNELRVQVDGVEPVDVSAHALPGEATAADYATVHHQHATAGAPVPRRPAVRVHDVHGNGVPGVAVTFTIIHGEGGLSGSPAETDETGIARVTDWVLGDRAGENRLVAEVEKLGSFEFIAVGETGAAAQVVVHQGSGQGGLPGVALPEPLAARVLDAGGNPVPGVQVSFEVTAGGGSLLGAQPISNGNGVALAGAWTLGPEAGEQRVEARVENASPALFTASVRVGPPTRLEVSSTAQQNVAAGASVPDRPAVRLLDAAGNPVPSTAVGFAVTSGGGSVEGAVVTTDSDGFARVGSWRTGTQGGLNRLSVTADGVPQVHFTAHATPSTWPVKISANVNSGGIVKRYIQVSGAGLSGEVDITQPLEVPVGVTLTGDPGAAPAGWVFSHWEFHVFNPFSPQFQSLENPGPKSGSNVLMAVSTAQVPFSVKVEGPVDVRLVYRQQQDGSQTDGGGGNESGGSGGDSEGESGGQTGHGATLMQLNAGDQQEAVVGKAVSQRPSVRLLDAQGQPVGGVPVTFQVITGGGVASIPDQTTFSNGVAIVGAWHLGPNPGLNELRATAPGLPSIVFSANGVASGSSSGGEDTGGSDGDGDGSGAGGGEDDPPPPPTGGTQLAVVEQIRAGQLITSITINGTVYPLSGTKTTIQVPTDVDLQMHVPIPAIAGLNNHGFGGAHWKVYVYKADQPSYSGRPDSWDSAHCSWQSLCPISSNLSGPKVEGSLWGGGLWARCTDATAGANGRNNPNFRDGRIGSDTSSPAIPAKVNRGPMWILILDVGSQAEHPLC